MFKSRFHISELLMKLTALFGVAVILFIFFFVFYKSAPVIANSGLGLISSSGFDAQISEAFYAPQDEPMLSFGMLGLIVGTLLSTVFALAVAGILGIGCAVAICELAPKKLASVLISLIRLLASIPSVIFGLIGVILVVPWIEKTFITVDMQIEYLQFFQMTGRNLLTTTIILSFMIVPTLVTMACDALYAVPDLYRETGMAFGMNKMRITGRILLPAARPGIIAGFVLAAGRGIGEAIAVSMVCGGIGIIPSLSHGIAALLTPVLPLSAAIMNKSEAMSVPAVESALFSCGALLLVMGTLLSLTARIFIKKSVKRGMISEG